MGDLVGRARTGGEGGGEGGGGHGQVARGPTDFESWVAATWGSRSLDALLL